MIYCLLRRTRMIAAKEEITRNMPKPGASPPSVTVMVSPSSVMVVVSVTISVMVFGPSR